MFSEKLVEQWDLQINFLSDPNNKVRQNLFICDI